MKLTNNLSREDKKMINSICWRSLNAHCSRVGGQARQMAIGFLWQIMPALNRYCEAVSYKHLTLLTCYTGSNSVVFGAMADNTSDVGSDV